MEGTQNTLLDLNNHLFEQLERLRDAENGVELKEELNRSKGISELSTKVIENGKLVLDATKFKHDDRMDANREVPRMLKG